MERPLGVFVELIACMAPVWGGRPRKDGGGWAVIVVRKMPQRRPDSRK